jgi:hypothetical protein
VFVLFFFLFVLLVQYICLSVIWMFFSFISHPRDIVIINELNVILKIISQCDVKPIMTYKTNKTKNVSFDDPNIHCHQYQCSSNRSWCDASDSACFDLQNWRYISMKWTNVNNKKYCPRNENLNLLVRIKFLNLFLYIFKKKLKNLLVLNKVLLVLGWRTGAHYADCYIYIHVLI